MKQKIILIGLVIFLGLGISLYSIFQINNTKKVYKKIEQVSILVEKIKYYDEVLTMSARMISYNDNLKWIDRYYQNVPLLDKSINDSIKLIPQIKEELSKVDNVNQKLIEIEEKAIMYAKNKKFQEAQVLLRSDEYIAYKQEYKKGLQKAIDVISIINIQLEENTKKYQDTLELNIIISILIIIIGIFYIYNILTRAIETEQYKTLIELSSDGIHIIDKKGNIIQCSKSFTDTLGYTQEEILNLNIQDIYLDTENYNLTKDINSIMVNKKSIIFETKHKRKDGSIINVQINAKGIEIKGKRYLFASQRDITDLKEKDYMLLEQSKMASMGEMIANIAHQWRQPLSVISTIASGVKLNYTFGVEKPKDQVIKNMNSIVQNTKHLSNTIDTFRNFIRSEKIKKNVVVQDEISQAVNIIKSSLENKFILLEDNIDYLDKTILNMTAGELPQVIINIINNAKDIIIEKNVEDGIIKLDLIKDTDYITMIIEDNGGGIPEDVLPRIFEPYFTTKHQSQGTGLGLHMGYKIITESLNGKLYVKNTNNGAKFFIKLPLK